MLQQAQQYITNGRGEKVGAVVDIKVYNKMIDALDEYRSIKEYRSAKEKTNKELSRGEFISVADLRTKFEKKKKRK